MRVVRLKVPDLAPHLAEKAVEFVQQLRHLDLKKQPSVSETLDWARALVFLNATSLDQETLDASLSLLLKYETDAQRVLQEMTRDDKPGRSGSVFSEVRRLLTASLRSDDN